MNLSSFSFLALPLTADSGPRSGLQRTLCKWYAKEHTAWQPSCHNSGYGLATGSHKPLYAADPTRNPPPTPRARRKGPLAMRPKWHRQLVVSAVNGGFASLSTLLLLTPPECSPYHRLGWSAATSVSYQAPYRKSHRATSCLLPTCSPFTAFSSCSPPFSAGGCPRFGRGITDGCKP